MVKNRYFSRFFLDIFGSIFDPDCANFTSRRQILGFGVFLTRSGTKIDPKVSKKMKNQKIFLTIGKYINYL